MCAIFYLFINGSRSAEKISYGFKNLVKLGVGIFFFKITISRTIFNCSCKTSGFLNGYLLFWVNFLSFFFFIFLCKNFVFCEAGWFFLVKNFLMQNFSFCGAGCSLWFLFLSFFFIFSCKTSVFWEAGWSFCVKNTFFFMQNFGLCGVGWSFWYLFCYFFVLLFKLNRIILKKEIYLSILKLGFCCGLNPFGDSYAYQFLTKK